MTRPDRGDSVKFTIDTEVDSYEQAVEAFQAAYGRPPAPHGPTLNITARERLRRQRTGDTGPADADVIWQHKYGAWSEAVRHHVNVFGRRSFQLLELPGGPSASARPGRHWRVVSALSAIPTARLQSRAVLQAGATT